MSYRKLTIWQLACQLVIDIHKMTLTKLPEFELYEEGSQICRSIKSVKSNIVEGYGMRRYQAEFIPFLTYSLASCDETTDHYSKPDLCRISFYIMTFMSVCSL